MAESEITFQPGDIVQLNSGGPLVTVSSVLQNGTTFTYYYVNEKGLIYEQEFAVLTVAFHKVDPPREPYKGPFPIA